MKHDEMIAVIQAHKEGKKIQVRHKCSSYSKDWVDTCPVFDFHECEYRIKPEPKPDIVRYGRASFLRYDETSTHDCLINERNTQTYWTIKKSNDNIKAIWDGETFELKSVEIIK